MITTTPAHALGCSLQLGTLKSGSWADWVGWRLPETREDPIPQILESHDLAEVTCVAGKVVHHEQV
jgi:imidazolonepropionase-like amidohydrolase